MHIDDLFGFALESMPDVEAEIEAVAATAKAHVTRSRTIARRAASESMLSTILPADIADGESWHVLSSGDIDAMSYLAHLVENHQMDYVAFSTWCMALDDVSRLQNWLADGRVKKIDAYVGEIFPGSYPKEYAALLETVKVCGGRVAVFRNHSKVFLCRSGSRAWVVESSANINTNPRTENACITADVGLYEHHKSYFDAIRSFSRDCDDWTPTR